MIFPAAAPVLGDSDCNKTVRFAIEKVTVYLSTRLLDNGVAFMRPALDTNRLTHIYNRSARWYDVQHGCLTAWTDQKGRRMVVDQTVRERDDVLDAGAGTGLTSLLAAEKVGPLGHVTLLDLSKGMLESAKRKITPAELLGRFRFEIGNMLHLPFEDATFDAVLSTFGGIVRRRHFADAPTLG